jgi:AraC-like DNA-binding protein
MDIAPKSLQECFKGFPVNINNLHEKYCDSNKYYVIRSAPTIEHIFTELYAVPKKIKDYYFKIKIFELLLYLDALEISDHQEKRPYFYKAQVEKIKSIESLITNNLEHHYTLDDLSERFDISLTPMKSCFKGVYGTSIYAYIRSYRMSTAAVLLKTTQKSVAEIACKVGYSSPSKFSSAFKDVMAMTPIQYRKSSV